MDEKRGVDSNILIIDDEERLTSILRMSLQVDIPESRVDAAHSGEEGLSCLAQRSYDLIIADLRMPGVDGLALVKGVRYLDPGIPIVLMTAYGSPAVQEQANRLGVDYYFSKPFDYGEMVSVVRQLLPGPKAASA